MKSSYRSDSSIFGIYHVGNREFVVREDCTDEDGNRIPGFPTLDPPEYDQNGRPYALASNEGCEYFACDIGMPGRQLCCDCKYLLGDPIGLCMCDKRKISRGSDDEKR